MSDQQQAESLRRVITETDIIASRQRVAAAMAAGKQTAFEDALLGSAGVTPDMISEWLDAGVNVHWCACENLSETPAPIACPNCGLPVFWKEEEVKVASTVEAPVEATDGRNNAGN